MRRVLIPTDFSSVSKNALDYALELYKNTETVFDVIHIYHPSFDPVNPEIIDSSLGMERVKKENMVKLISTISEDAKNYNIEVNSKVEIGFTIEKVIELSNNYELIIMGSTGTDNFFNKIFGGVSSDVASKANCPVLLIPSKVDFVPIKNIIYSCDFDGVAKIVLNEVINFAKRHNSAIHFVHIEDISKEFNIDIPDNIELTYTVNIVEADSINEGVSDYIEEKHADMVIMATKKRSFWQKIIHRSHTKEFALNTKVPLLVYHEKNLI